MNPLVRVASFVAIAALPGGVSACSSDEKAVPFDDGKDQVAAADLGSPREAYPAAPYGSRPGAIIQNFNWLGWHTPKDTAFDTSKLEPLSLGQFYDPNGDKGVKLLVMTSTAVWCSACKQEYKDMTGSITDYEAKGVRFLGALFEDNQSQPAKPSDLVLWAKAYNVNFPFALDPDLKLGSFFDVEATPMEMIVDAKTMKILRITEGWVSAKGEGSLWADLDGLLATR
jgi:peroxiredoxin